MHVFNSYFKLFYKKLFLTWIQSFCVDALATEEWKRLVVEHEARIKVLEEKYKAICEADKVGICSKADYLLISFCFHCIKHILYILNSKMVVVQYDIIGYLIGIDL